MRRFDLLAIGEPLYELNQQPGGLFLPGFGGDTLNVTIAASRLGARSAYVTRLGGDIFGDALDALMRSEAIDMGCVTRDAAAPTGLYFVTHGPAGHVFTYRRAGSAASLMSPADIDDRLLGEAAIVHASGISQAISLTADQAVSAALAMARAAGAVISYDTNYRARLWPVSRALPAVAAAAAMADILKTSTDDCAALIGLSDPPAIADHFLGLGSRAVIVTLGREGVYLATGEARLAIAGFAVASVDATGAGDAFTGAMLAELARGRALPEAVRFGNAAAALSTTGYGAIAPLPRRAAVEALLAGG